MKNSTSVFPKPPAFLDFVPRSIVRKLDAAEALLFALDSRSRSSAYGPHIALGSLRSTLAAAQVQQQRIRRAKKSILQKPLTGGRINSLFFDVHFYLICWARIDKLATFVARHTGFQQPKLVLRRYRSRLDRMSDFRDHLEHFEERLPGSSARHETLRVPADLFNMFGDSVTIGGDTVNVGIESFSLLAGIVDEFEEAVLFDALETLWSVEPARVSHLLRRAALPGQILRTTRQIQRMLGQIHRE